MKFSLVAAVLVGVLSSCSGNEGGQAGGEAPKNVSRETGGADHSIPDAWTKEFEAAKGRADGKELARLAKAALDAGDERRFELAAREAYSAIKSDSQAMMGLAMFKIENADDYVKFLRREHEKSKQREAAAAKEKEAAENRRQELFRPFKDSPYKDLAARALKQLEGDREFVGRALHLIGDTIEAGDVTVRLVSFGKARRKLLKLRLMDKPEPIEMELWGGLVEVENKSQGKLVRPFPSWGDCNLSGRDSWDNRLTRKELDGVSDYHPAEGSIFKLTDADAKPLTKEVFLLAIYDIEVLNFDYLILRLGFMPSNTGNSDRAFFLVPKDKIDGVK